MTQHRKTKGRARHRTALRRAAELYIAGLMTSAGSALFVIQQQRNMYKPGVVLIVPVRGYDTSNVTGMCELVKVQQSTQHVKSRQSTAPRSAEVSLLGALLS